MAHRKEHESCCSSTIDARRGSWRICADSRAINRITIYCRLPIPSSDDLIEILLEKEALVKGLPIGQAIDIEIPPPRPKRKPSNPYPRKSIVGTATSQVVTKFGIPVVSDCSVQADKHVLDLEREPTTEKQSDIEHMETVKENKNSDDCSEALSFFQEAPSASKSSENKNPMPLIAPNGRYTFREFVPVLKEVVNQEATNESSVVFEARGGASQSFEERHSCNSSKFGSYHSSHDKLIDSHKTHEGSTLENFDVLSLNDTQSAAPNYPRHVAVHVVNGSLGTSTQSVSPDISFEGSLYHHMGLVNGNPPNLFGNLTAASATDDHDNASRSCICQSIPTFHPPFIPVPRIQDDCQSVLHIPSTFSSLLASVLLQNPAAHAAATFAATFWPVANVKASAGPPTSNTGDSSARQITAAPSVEAIAAATVTAATAWWAAHGLLPLSTPFNTGYNCSPAPMSTTPMENSEARAVNNVREKTDQALNDQKLVPKCTESFQQHLDSKSPPLSSSESAEGEDGKLNSGLSIVHPEQAGRETELHDSNKMKLRKPVDRSSCGSNTASSSEVETDALEKHDNVKEESNGTDICHLTCDPSNRRGRVCSSPNESWKEVSQGGRLAFQALFSREVLPQSFDPSDGQQKNNFEKDKQDTHEKGEQASQFDLNSIESRTCTNYKLVENNVSLITGNNAGDGMLATGVGYPKFKARRTGFKPYKRCSVEAKESRVACTTNPDEAKAPKRMRLEGGPQFDI